MKGFSRSLAQPRRAALSTRRAKELIALGIAARCDACISFHTQALVKLGASKAEIEETLGVAVYIGGGPSLMYAAKAVEAFEEYSGA
jgi:AhpD family alkylhydroperoxidase